MSDLYGMTFTELVTAYSGIPRDDHDIAEIIVSWADRNPEQTLTSKQNSVVRAARALLQAVSSMDAALESVGWEPG